MKDYSNYHPSHHDKLIYDGEKLFNIHMRGFEGKDGYIDEIPAKFIVQETSNPLNENKEERKITCLSETQIHRGSLVKFDSEVYLVVSDVDDNTIIKTAKILKTNNTLKFYDENGILYEVPCVVESAINFYKIGQDQTKYISEPNTSIIVRCPNDSITKKIKRDMVFSLSENENYEVTDINSVIQNGLLVMKMDYTSSSPKEVIPTFTVKILNAEPIYCNLFQRPELVVEVKKDGLILENPSIEFIVSDNTICKIEGNTIIPLALGESKIKVSLIDYPEIFDEISIVVEVMQYDNYSVEFSPDSPNAIFAGKSESFKCIFKNNGMIIQEQSIFYLTDDDGFSPTSLATIIEQDNINNTCLIKAGKQSGYCKLWVINLQNTIVSKNPLRIQIKSLI